MNDAEDGLSINNSVGVQDEECDLVLAFHNVRGFSDYRQIEIEK